MDVRVFAMPEVFTRLDEANRGRVAWWRTIHLLFVAAFTTYTCARIFRLRSRNPRLIVHSHSASYCLLVSALSRAWGCRGIHTFHSPIDAPNPVLRFLALKVDTVIFVSQSLESLYRSYGVRPSNVRIIPGAVDLKVYRPPSLGERENARAAVNLRFPMHNAAGPLLLFVGRIVPEKGVDVLLDAGARLLGMFTNIRILVVGPYDSSTGGTLFAQRCREAVSALGLKGHVALVGALHQEELVESYWAADLFVCPSTWDEPAPLVVSEALACGLPIVATDRGGLPERVDEGLTGRLVHAGDPARLATAISEILQNPDLRASYARRARERAVRNLGTDTLLSLHVDLYATLLRDSTGCGRTDQTIPRGDESR